jgi:hypothetical protein
MSKKSKKKNPEPIGFTASSEHLLLLKGQPNPGEEKEPSFDELWRQSVDGIKKLEQDHSEAYWAKVAKEKYAPLLFPRRKSEQLEFWDKLAEKGFRKKGRTGRPFKYGGPIQLEVQGIYRSLMEEKLQLHLRVKIKKTTKLKDISKEEKLLFDLPFYGPETWKKWWPLFLSRFMNKYHGKPEQHSPFYLEVKKNIEGENPSYPLPADSLYREAVKESFETKVKSYASQPYELRT